MSQNSRSDIQSRNIPVGDRRELETDCQTGQGVVKLESLFPLLTEGRFFRQELFGEMSRSPVCHLLPDGFQCGGWFKISGNDPECASGGVAFFVVTAHHFSGDGGDHFPVSDDGDPERMMFVEQSVENLKQPVIGIILSQLLFPEDDFPFRFETFFGEMGVPYH